ncbi:MAG: hypothetical protein KAR85_07045, partial [Methanosarcinales archaeon]|nr:hypothetical protein [Methanosarcinales archaeon]
MNKKINAVLISALMVLTMFAALVPSASAVEEVSAPYEFLGAVNGTPAAGEHFNVTANSRDNPSLLYYDLDDEDGNETLDFFTLSGDSDTIGDENLTYTTTFWTDGSFEYVSWLGDKYRVAERGGGEWVISEELVDEDEDDDHLLRVGESLNLAEGFAITALEIDVEGDEAWLSLTKDGEEIDSEVVSAVTGTSRFVYEDDFDEADDVEIMNFTVETVFAGMNSNLIKINSISLISMDLLEVESGDDEPFGDYRTTITDTVITIRNDDDISL